MKLRICRVCKIEKEIEEFPKYLLKDKVCYEHRCRSCKRIDDRDRNRLKRSDNLHRIRERHAAYLLRVNNPSKAMYDRAKKRASKTGLRFDLEISDINIPEFCPLIGIKLKQNKGCAGDDSPSVDRINSTLGYTKDNVRVISRLANIMKANATNEQLLLFVKNLPDYLNNQVLNKSDKLLENQVIDNQQPI